MATDSVKLNAILPKLESFEDFTLDCVLKKKGGREVVLINDDDEKEYRCKFKDLIKHVRVLGEKELKETKNVEDTKEKISHVINDISTDLLTGDVSLKMANIWQKIITFFRQLFGNGGSPSHIKALERIRNKMVLPENLSKEAQEVKKELENLDKKHSAVFKKFVQERTKAKSLSEFKKVLANTLKEVDGKPLTSLTRLVNKDWMQASLLVRDLGKKHPALTSFIYCYERDQNLKTGALFSKKEREFAKTHMLADAKKLQAEEQKKKADEKKQATKGATK